MGERDIAHLQGHDLGAAQGSIVAQQKHELIAQRLPRDNVQDGGPLIVTGYPWQAFVPPSITTRLHGGLSRPSWRKMRLRWEQ
jgi:hypothetical protein